MKISKLVVYPFLTAVLLGGNACNQKTKEGPPQSDSLTATATDTIKRVSKEIKHPNPLRTVEDSIKQHFGINDSILVMQTRYYGSPQTEHSRAFIDFNKHSRFYDDLLSIYGCDCIDDEIYTSEYNNQLIAFRDSVSHDINQYKHLFGHWIPIYPYRGNFYLNFITCEFNRHGFTLSDSTLVEYPMDGPYPQLLLGITETADQITIRKVRAKRPSRLILNLVPGSREIYSVDEGNWRYYLVHQSDIHNHLMIVEDCHEVGASFEEYKRPEKRY